MPTVSNLIQAPEAHHSSIGGLPQQQDDATSSRSTSAYSTYPPSAYPAMPLSTAPPPPHASLFSPVMGNMPVNHHDAMRFRLPSDQMQQLIDAIKQPTPPAISVSSP